MNKEQIIQFYQDEYREVSKASKKRNVKTAHYLHRLNAKAKSLSHCHSTRAQSGQLKMWHKEVKQLAFLAYYTNNKEAKRVLNKQIIPELVRIDLELFESDEELRLGEDFIKELQKKQHGAICNTHLYDLYIQLRQAKLQAEIMDLVPAKPQMEFPEAIEMNRRFILHVGPTNSGKTYQALERLKQAEVGVYLGPLRLLALEVYERMMDEGIPCTMLTGQECIEEPNSRITASTVEMLDIDKVYDVAVIDEAQMVADEDRGYAWTRAILGVRAHEVHICMSPVAKGVVTHLISLCNDEYEIREYERKTQLVFTDIPFDFPKEVEPGDALIVFSKRSVLNIAGRLEEYGISSSVIYGSLPPEIRRRQMDLFNTGQTKVVVSTDAIGMGLNLPVKRIVFLEMEKYDGKTRRPLEISEIKQIAGRAGRYGLYDTGYVTAMGAKNHNYLKRMENVAEEEITEVNLGFPQVLLGMDAPLDEIITLWKDVPPSEPFKKINIDEILFLYKEADKNKAFIADFDDKRMLYKMVTCPVDIKDREVVDQWRRYCMSYTSDIELDHPYKGSRYQGLQRLESYYKKLDLYYQLSVRLGKFADLDWLEEERDDIQNKIMQLLAKDKNEFIIRCKYCGKVLPIGATYNLCDNCVGIKSSKRW